MQDQNMGAMANSARNSSVMSTDDPSSRSMASDRSMMNLRSL